MSTADRDALLELAAEVADAAAIDWSAWRQRWPRLVGRVNGLALIAKIAATHRDASKRRRRTERETRLRA